MQRWILLTVVFFTALQANGQVGELRRRAAAGDAVAMMELSERYLFGRGVPQNQDSSNYWTQTALASNSPEAQYLVALQKTGQVFDAAAYREGIRLLQKAADQNHVDALARLSEIYRQNKTGTQSDQFYDLEKAFAWAQRAAEAGHAASQMRVGEAFLTGTGTTANDSLGMHWMTQAALNKYVPAQLRLAQLLLEGRPGASPAPYQALYWYRRVYGNRRANIDQRVEADLGIHAVDLWVRHHQNLLYSGMPLPPGIFHFEIRE